MYCIVSALATATSLCCYQQRRLALCAFINISISATDVYFSPLARHVSHISEIDVSLIVFNRIQYLYFQSSAGDFALSTPNPLLKTKQHRSRHSRRRNHHCVRHRCRGTVIFAVFVICNVYFPRLIHIKPRGGGKFTTRPTFCCVTPEP